MEKRYIQSEHGIIYYWIGGNQSKNANCIVFTHGMTADHTMFDKQVECFSEEYRIITWDVPLHGESRPYDEFSYYNVAYELKRILDKEKIDKVILVGQSMGGYVCQEFAIQYPEKVSAFVAVDTNPFGHCYYSKWERSLLSKVSTIASWFPHSILIRSIAKGATKTKYAYENLYDSVSKLDKKEIIFIMNMAYGGFLERKENIRFDFPVLLVVGDNDNTGYVKKYNQKWSKHDGYPLKFITNAAHNSNVDNYKEFNKITMDFLNSIGL
ncbi:alpha/beta fold hydrolase [Desulfitibacter alkalitolerans]|uniref:alpha/beta fold hydrolase n=1 Tax=Desulfitibacter alkalitolerans TaxID=264641 RepID=UPI00048921AD|nr:alpha/beta hydrolase [Desulfitibacter alkalitolerans]